MGVVVDGFSEVGIVSCVAISALVSLAKSLYSIIGSMSSVALMAVASNYLLGCSQL